MYIVQPFVVAVANEFAEDECMFVTGLRGASRRECAGRYSAIAPLRKRVAQSTSLREPKWPVGWSLYVSNEEEDEAWGWAV